MLYRIYTLDLINVT